ncbi:MAG: polymer-forming cytoskeletal protein [Thiotrichaceae bacterium]
MKTHLSKESNMAITFSTHLFPVISHAAGDAFASLCDINLEQIKCPPLPKDEQGITDLVADITRQFMQAAIEATQPPVTVAQEDTGINPPPPVTPPNAVEEPTTPGNPFEPVPVPPVQPETVVVKTDTTPETLDPEKSSVDPTPQPPTVAPTPVKNEDESSPTTPPVNVADKPINVNEYVKSEPPSNVADKPIDVKPDTTPPTKDVSTSKTVANPLNTEIIPPPPPSHPAVVPVETPSVTLPVDSSNSNTHTTCPQTKILTISCVADNQLLENITLDKDISVSQAQLRGTITNNGMISNATLWANSTLDGGKVSGTFTNLGTVQNIHFVGDKLQRGTLAGTIVSKGELADVTLAASAQIRGESRDAPAILSGKIQGDAAHPASLEHVKITANTQVTGVIFGANVTLDPQAILELPSFNHSSQVDNTGHLSATTATFSGGLSLSEPMNFTKTLTISSSQAVRLRVNIIPDAKHIGQRAQRLLVAGLGKQDKSGECTGGDNVSYKVLLRYQNQHNVDLYAEPTVWAPQLINRQEEDEKLAQQPLVFDDADLWESKKVTSMGCYYFFAGYRLAQNSTIVFDTTPLILNVK